MRPIIKRKDMILTMKNKDSLDLPSGPDTRKKDLRFQILSGPGGFYIYDYLNFSVPKNDGKYLSFPTKMEAEHALQTLPQQIMPYYGQ